MMLLSLSSSRRIWPALRPAALLLLALALSGCSNPQPPKPSPTVNAVIDGYRPIYRDTSASSSADVVLLASFDSRNHYSRTTIDNMEYNWELDLFAVNAIEKGNWNSPELAFILVDTQPMYSTTPASHPWPYYYGVTMRFWINTSSNPPRIVGQQTIVQ
jgi:hypothetical protein